jgi:hypothetical protein
MSDGKTRILLILPQSVLDDVRVLAGKATTTLKLSVSVQIVLRALIEEGLKRDGDRRLLASIESQAHAVRRMRSRAGRGREGPPARTRTEVRQKRGEKARGMRIGSAKPEARAAQGMPGLAFIDHQGGSAHEGHASRTAMEKMR